MDIFKSFYIYIYMQGITNAWGTPGEGTRSFPEEERVAPPPWRSWVRGREGAHKEHLATAGRGRPPPRPAAVTAAPSRASASPATLSVQEFNKSGVKAICHGIFEE